MQASLGRLMLRNAVLRTAQAAQIIGVRGILVHALSPAAERFYETCGLRESPASPMTLVVSLQDAIAALRAEWVARRGPALFLGLGWFAKA